MSGTYDKLKKWTYIPGLLVTSLFLAGCPSAAAGDLIVTSSVDLGHSHQITILASEIAFAPAEKIITTTVSGAHTHTVTLKTQDFAAIQRGQEITVSSSVADAHGHRFIIVRTSQGGGGGGY